MDNKFYKSRRENIEDKNAGEIKKERPKKKNRKQLLIIVIIILIILAFTWRLYLAEKQIEEERNKVEVMEQEKESLLIKGAKEDTVKDVIIDETIDSDNDGLTDAEEEKLGTNPNNIDTDKDGFSDWEEVKRGYDPLAQLKNGKTDIEEESVIVSDTSQLKSAISQTELDGPKTILLEDGTYVLEDMLWIEADGVTVRSASGNRDAVVIEGRGINGSATHIFNVAGSNFTARDMTLRNVANHAVQLQINADFASLINLHILDTGEQMVKVAHDENSMDLTSDNGLIEGCLFEYSEGYGPQYYIGGIDAHNAKNWVIRKNTFKNIKSPSEDVAEHAIHFWTNSEGTIVERNLIINCDRGIGFGLGDRGHIGGTIRNNMIYHDSTEGFADVPISLESAEYPQVYNNTIFTENSYPYSIEYRFPTTKYASIINNLTNKQIIQRDGAVGNVVNNITNAQLSWFIDPASGNLRLSSNIPEVVDKGQEVEGLKEDFDGKKRPRGTGIDIGADEF